MEGALVAVAALQEVKIVELSVADGPHILVESVDGANGLGVSVAHELQFPEVLVVEVWGAPVLESAAETGRVCENLEIPLLDGDIVVVFADVLGIRQHKSTCQQECQQCSTKVRFAETQFPHETDDLVDVVRIFSRHVVRIMAVGGASFLRVTSRKNQDGADKQDG